MSYCSHKHYALRLRSNVLCEVGKSLAVKHSHIDYFISAGRNNTKNKYTLVCLSTLTNVFVSVMKMVYHYFEAL